MFLTLIYFSSFLFAQVEWEKFSTNPVIVKDNNIWEWRAIGQPTVILENDTFKMWYASGGGVALTSWMKYAYSVDGIDWVKYGIPVMSQGSAGMWDSKWIDTPEILRDSSGYKLYYFGDTTTSTHMGAAVGLATSDDGINWIKYAENPVFEKGDSLEWDGFWIESPAILYDSGVYKMWYTGVAYDWKIRIGYAISSDGIIWTKYPGNPVLDLGTAGEWEDFWVGVPAVIKTDSVYEMFYCGVSQGDLSLEGIDTISIGYATSTDGINWYKHTNNPVLNTFSPPYNPVIDSGGPWAPDVVRDSSGYKMWYETKEGFCLAIAEIYGIEENSKLKTQISKLTAWPNPFCIATTIEFNVGNRSNLPAEGMDYSCKIYDISGKLIETHSINSMNSKNSIPIGKNLKSGIYFLKVDNFKPLKIVKTGTVR